jgi:hypothetical protein
MGDRVRVIHNRATCHEDLSKRQIEELAGLPVSKVFPNSYAEAAAATKEGRTIRANSFVRRPMMMIVSISMRPGALPRS